MDKMNIMSARYINDPLTNEANVGILVTIDGQELSVPLDPANRHYSQIMRQVEAGELVIQEAE
jgi:hypothetical protein